MQELDVIDLPDGSCGTIVHIHSDGPVIVVEIGPELVDYEIDENGLKEISRMVAGPQNLMFDPSEAS